MPTKTSPLRGVELDAWRTFLRAHAQVTRTLEHELLAAHGLSLPAYDVLATLVGAPQQRLRMSDLADQVLLSRSGLTRLVDRLQGEGLVQRTACPTDARSTHAVLTERGRQALREATPTHLRGVSEHVTTRLSDGELETLHELLGRLVHEPQPASPSGGCAAH